MGCRSGENLEVMDQLFEGKVIRVSIREEVKRRCEQVRPWKVSAVRPEYICCGRKERKKMIEF